MCLLLKKKITPCFMIEVSGMSSNFEISGMKVVIYLEMEVGVKTMSHDAVISIHHGINEIFLHLT
jgi:hypothetical protein